MTLWVATPTTHHMGEHSIETRMCLKCIFLLQISCGTIFVSVSFGMSKAPEKPIYPRGVLTPILIFVKKASIFRQVVGGQVPKERNNWKLNSQGGFGESRSKMRYRSPGWIPFRGRAIKIQFWILHHTPDRRFHHRISVVR